MPRAIHLWILPALCLLTAACTPALQTHTDRWPNGAPHARESYYINSSGRKVPHGRAAYWDQTGALIAEGTWRHGQPLNGVCWIPAAGDAGSVAGLGHFERYQDGQSLGQLPGSPYKPHIPLPP